MSMGTKFILWIDDDYPRFTGLESYLQEIPDVDLRLARSISEAEEHLAGSEIDLMLFDMVLMKDALHATLGRRTSMVLVHRALERKVGLFVAYTVLSKIEVNASWQKLVSSIGIDFTPEFQYFSKNTSSVLDVVNGVRKFLKVGV